eukprot:194531-Prorocentrum_minimum.AAC.1
MSLFVLPSELPVEPSKVALRSASPQPSALLPWGPRSVDWKVIIPRCPVSASASALASASGSPP